MNDIGVNKDELDTPALLVDLELVDKNILQLADYLKSKKTKLRAHTKVHRIPFLAHKQLNAGAVGICCQKVSAAEVMVSAGIKDVMVTNQIVTPQKILGLVALAKVADVSVPVDNENNAQCLSRAAEQEGVVLNVLVDVHLGSQRCGIEPGEPGVDSREAFVH